MNRKHLVYDWPTRIFHGLFTALFLGAFLITKTVEDESVAFVYYMLLGVMLVFLVVLRLIWGIVGTRYAKFSMFPMHPVSLLRYGKDIITGKTKRNLGHNPASAWASVLMMLFALGLGATGYLLTNGEGNKIFEEVHGFMANALLAVALVHVAGVLFHTFKHRDGIGWSMIDGKKLEVHGDTPIGSARPIAGILLVLLLAAFGTAMFRNFDSKNLTLSFRGSVLHLGEVENEQEDSEKED